jgi:hypothetical protein
LDASPIKDEFVPRCAWAGRLRSVTFKALEPDDKNAPSVRQFAPNQPWNELIPGHPNPPGVPGEWLKKQILCLVKDANRHGSEWNAFEFLAGRWGSTKTGLQGTPIATGLASSWTARATT